VVDSRIRKRITEILATHPEIEEIIEEFHTKAELAITSNNSAPEPVESKIPGELRQELTKQQLKILEMLLEEMPTGDCVSNQKLCKELYGETLNDNEPAPRKLMVRVTEMRKIITGWGKIVMKKGRGYTLVLDEAK
jgi:DNA-binding response OmpR family regulator